MNPDVLCRFLLWSLAVNYAFLLTWFLAFVFARNGLRALHGLQRQAAEMTFDVDAIHSALIAKRDRPFGAIAPLLRRREIRLRKITERPQMFGLSFDLCNPAGLCGVISRIDHDLGLPRLGPSSRQPELPRVNSQRHTPLAAALYAIPKAPALAALAGNAEL